MGLPEAPTAPKVIRFQDYEVDLKAGQLHKNDIRIGLREKSFQVLAALLEHPGEVVTREELRQRLWQDDVFVDFDNNLNTAVARLRVALNDSAENPRYIETLPKRGYRFVGELSESHATPFLAPVSLPRLLVLPLVNLTGDPTQEYLCDAMTEEVISELATLAPDRLAVIARTTAMHYRNSQKDVAQIGRELSVDYVVEGSLRRAEDRMVLNVQFILVSEQTHLFALTHSAALAEMFEVKSKVAQTIAMHLGMIPPQAPRRPTNDFRAYNCYVQGRYHTAKATPTELEIGRQLLEEAIARDPEFALAYDALAELHWARGFVGLTPPKDAGAAGMAYGLRAIEIDDTLAETHALLGQFHKSLDYNWPEVHKELTRALELNPVSSTVRLRYAVNGLMPHGRVEEAISQLERALELDPLSLYTLNWMAVMLVLAHQYDRAIDQTRVLHEFYPMSHWGYLVLGVAYREKRNFAESIASHRQAVELSGGSPLMLGWLGLALGSSGEHAEARSLLADLHNMVIRTYIPPSALAWTYLGLDELDSAFEWMDRAVDARDDMMMAIKNYAFFDPIRSDPRYLSLLRKMNLEP